MSKPAAIFVAAAMAVTAGCLGVMASYGFGLGAAGTFLVAAVALAMMAVIHIAFLRASPRRDPRIDDIDRVVTDLQSRLEVIELRLSGLDGAADRARAMTKPLVDEIAALGGLVATIAKEVESHDTALAELAPPKPAASAGPARREAPSREAAVVAPPSAPQPSVTVPPPQPVPAPAIAAAPPAAGPKLQRPEPLDIDAIEIAPAAPPALPDGLGERILRALGRDGIEPHLQPIATLPSRRTAHYEALARLVEADGVTEAAELVEAAAAIGRLPAIDLNLIERCAAVALRLSARGGGSVFVNLAPETLADPDAFGAIKGLFDGREELRRLIVLEFGQPAFGMLVPEARAALEALVADGVRLSIDKVADLRLDARELNRQGVHFVKVAAGKLLDPESARGAAIHPADLSSLLARNSIDLIATHVEEERTVPELLDMEVTLAQGRLFGSPRPVRPAAT